MIGINNESEAFDTLLNEHMSTKADHKKDGAFKRSQFWINKIQDELSEQQFAELAQYSLVSRYRKTNSYDQVSRNPGEFATDISNRYIETLGYPPKEFYEYMKDPEKNREQIDKILHEVPEEIISLFAPWYDEFMKNENDSALNNKNGQKSTEAFKETKRRQFLALAAFGAITWGANKHIENANDAQKVKMNIIKYKKQHPEAFEPIMQKLDNARTTLKSGSKEAPEFADGIQKIHDNKDNQSELLRIQNYNDPYYHVLNRIKDRAFNFSDSDKYGYKGDEELKAISEALTLLADKVVTERSTGALLSSQLVAEIKTYLHNNISQNKKIQSINDKTVNEEMANFYKSIDIHDHDLVVDLAKHKIAEGAKLDEVITFLDSEIQKYENLPNLDQHALGEIADLRTFRDNCQNLNKIIDSEMEALYENFVPHKDNKKVMRPIDIAKKLVKESGDKHAFEGLHGIGPQALANHFTGPEAIKHLYDVATQRRADYFYDKFLPNKLNDIANEEDGLRAIVSHRGRRDTIAELIQRVKADTNNYGKKSTFSKFFGIKHSKKQREALITLQDLYIQSLKEDLKSMPKHLAEQKLADLESSSALAPVGAATFGQLFSDRRKTLAKSIKELHDIADKLPQTPVVEPTKTGTDSQFEHELGTLIHQLNSSLESEKVHIPEIIEDFSTGVVHQFAQSIEDNNDLESELIQMYSKALEERISQIQSHEEYDGERTVLQDCMHLEEDILQSVQKCLSENGNLDAVLTNGLTKASEKSKTSMGTITIDVQTIEMLRAMKDKAPIENLSVESGQKQKLK